MGKGTTSKCKTKSEGGTKWEIIHKARFNGQKFIGVPRYRLKIGEMNFRLYYGGVFVTNKKKRQTTYEPGPTGFHGLSLHPNVEECCYFEFAYWIRQELKYEDVGEIWFRKKNFTLFTGRKQLESDKEIPELLESPESDGWYNLYVVHHERVDNVGGGKIQEEGPHVCDEYVESEYNNEYEEYETLDNVEEWFNMHQLFGVNNKGKGKADESTSHRAPHVAQPNPRSENTLSLISSTTNQPCTPSFSQKQPQKYHSSRIKGKATARSRKWQACEDLGNAETVVEGGLGKEQEEGSGSEDDSDVDLSDDDWEDQEDDDLFAANVDETITERVTRSLGGSQALQVHHPQTEQAPVTEEPGLVDLSLGDDVDLCESDDDVESLPDSDDERGIHYPVFNPQVDFKDKIKLSKGLKFPSVSILRKALRYHAVENGYNYYFLHNDNFKVTVFCVNKCDCNWKHSRIVKCSCDSKKKCKFKVHCKKVKGEATIQIRTINLNHVCGRQHENNKVTAMYLAERFLDEWRDSPTWKLRDFMLRARRVTGVSLGYYKCYNARQIAMRMIHGDAADQYRRVWDYAEAIRQYNPGSTAVVKCIGIEHPPSLFQRMYICLQPCKEGFMAGCRPILGVDGCHLRGAVPGICLTVVGKDGNNNLFPVAWAIVETENRETWEWFLELLVVDLGSVAQDLTWVRQGEESVTYMTDRQKGLLDAFNKVIPRAEIRFCCRHIWANFKLKFPGQLYKQYFYMAARASTKFHFNQQMEAIKKLSPDAYNYLNNYPACHWSRHAFSTRCKSGMLLNNCCESFNNVIREARSMPILGMLEWIRRWVMKMCCAKRDGLKNFQGMIMPSVVKMIDRASEQVSKCDVTQADVHEFEVDHVSTGETYVVNLQSRTCGCFRWELMGIPCYHALACIAKQRFNWEDYVHPAYHVSTYAKSYAPAFHPMPGKNQWPKTTFPEPLPPAYKKLPGRPKGKKRIKEPGEGEDASYVVKNKKQSTCKNCGQFGHYQKTYKNPHVPPPPPPPVNKGGRPKKGAAAATTNAPPTTTTTTATPATTNAATTTAPQHSLQPASTTATQATSGPSIRIQAPKSAQSGKNTKQKQGSSKAPQVSTRSSSKRQKTNADSSASVLCSQASCTAQQSQASNTNS